MTSYYVMKKGIHSVSIIIKNMIRMRSQMQKKESQNSKEIKNLQNRSTKDMSWFLKQDKKLKQFFEGN